MAMPGALVTSPMFGVDAMDYPTTRRAQASRTTAQYTFAFAGRVLSDVGDPQLVPVIALKLAVDAVSRSDNTRDAPIRWPS